jgi:hypothetical protein
MSNRFLSIVPEKLNAKMLSQDHQCIQEFFFFTLSPEVFPQRSIFLKAVHSLEKRESF